MDFTLLHKLQGKQSQWMSVVFYFVCALLATVICCYGIFAFKVYLEQKRINTANQALSAFDTDQQKAAAQVVISDKKKIDDFLKIVKSHRISLNAFTFIEEKTLPSVWFTSLNVSEIENSIDVSGSTDSMATLSRQIQAFEASQDYVKNISVLNSRYVNDKSIDFTLNISLDQKIFDYANPATNTVNTEPVIVPPASLNTIIVPSKPSNNGNK